MIYADTNRAIVLTAHLLMLHAAIAGADVGALDVRELDRVACLCVAYQTAHPLAMSSALYAIDRACDETPMLRAPVRALLFPPIEG